MTNLNKNQEVISRFMDQPIQMSKDIKKLVEAEWNNRPVCLYAACDLDTSLNLHLTWVALGAEDIAIVRENPDDQPPEIRTFNRSAIKEIQEQPGLSYTVLTLFGSPGDPALAVLRYTHRQRQALEKIKFVLEEGLEGRQVETEDADEIYEKAMAQSVVTAQAAVSGNKLAVVWRLVSYLKPYRKQLALGMTAASILTLLTLVPPFLTGYVIDSVIKPFQAGTLDKEGAMSIAWLLVATIAVVFIIREICAYFRLNRLAMLGEYVAKDLRDALFSHLQKLSLSYFSKRQTGGLISRCSSDTDRLWDFIAFGIVEVSLSILLLFGLGTVLIMLDWRLGLLMTLPVPIFLYAIFAHGELMKRYFLRIWRKWSNMTDVLASTIPGMRVVKAFDQGENEINRFEERNDAVLEECGRIHKSWTVFWPILMLGIQTMTIIVWAVALPRVLSDPTGATSLSIGTFVSFLLYMGMFMHPIETIGQVARMLNKATSSAHRIFEVLDAEPEVRDAVEPICLEPVAGHVKFEDVTFSYDGVRQILKGVSFDVKPGEVIGLAGPSGSGKSTITNLISRFYDATGGRILIDNVDIKDLDSGHFRQQVGMVLQEPLLFHGSILENIRYGLPEADLTKVIESTKAANAHDFICGLPHGYDTIIGERGHTLSGGERQRVSIARAILTDPRILILDEATSSVDTETEHKIQEALDRLIAGRTVFAIAHRLSTLKKANRLFVVEKGKIAETGTHAELLAKEDGIYKKLYKMQQNLHESFAL